MALGTCYGFYYNTKNSIDAHSRDIRELQEDVTSLKTDVNSTNIFKGMTQVEQRSLNDRVTRIENKMDKALDILDRIDEKK